MVFSDEEKHKWIVRAKKIKKGRFGQFMIEKERMKCRKCGLSARYISTKISGLEVGTEVSVSLNVNQVEVFL